MVFAETRHPVGEQRCKPIWGVFQKCIAIIVRREDRECKRDTRFVSGFTEQQQERRV